MNRIAGRAGIAVLLVLCLMAGLLFFVGEYFVKAEDWANAEGSPHVYNAGNIGCGIVTDRGGTMLMDLTDGRRYSESLLLRMATLHWLGDREGNISAPALPSHAENMSGFDLVNGVYSYNGSGGEAVLTLSAQAQKTALEAMDGYKGTVAVYNYETGEILCAVSSPTYDPDDVPDILGDTSGAYEGAYLNRFTQVTYVPGSIFKVLTTAAALENMPNAEDWTFYCEGSYYVDGNEVTCEEYHGELTLETALAYSCNCAFAEIAGTLGADVLEDYVKKYHLTESLTFDGITTAEGYFNLENATAPEVAWSAIGQHQDLVNPARFLTFMGAIAGDGSAAEPYLVEHVSSGGATTYSARTVTTGRMMTKATAEKLQDYMRNNVVLRYGDENFPGLTVCAKSGTAELGGDQASNAMFAGFVMDDEYPLAFFVAVEGGGYGRHTCVPIISQVLQTCVDVLDGE